MENGWKLDITDENMFATSMGSSMSQLCVIWNIEDNERLSWLDNIIYNWLMVILKIDC